MRGIRIAALLALSLTSLSSANAQRATSLEGGFLTAFEDAVFLVGFRTTAVSRGVGVDFSLGTLPQGIAEGLWLLLPNVDVTSAVPIGSSAWLLPRAGVSALLGFGGGGGGAIPGVNVGIGLLGRMGERSGARLDVTYVRFLSDGESAGFTALTFGYAWMK
jgi:hypothetical protein